ncbi:LysR family transcriptional regulator [Variovorax paradoxus]|uniref:LysR family transcriptional regulator n=1 Tax=Variovorax paradoxus TaxID=34073 RepID=UPI003ECD0F6C
MTIQVTLNEIQDFVAIAAAGGIRAAARARGITSPAMTQSISRLEDKLKAPLALRTSKGITLTAFGQQLLPHYQAICAELSKSNEALRHLQGNDHGEITVGSSLTPIMVLMPDSLKDFRARLPNVRVNVVGGLYQAHIGALRAGTMDLAIGPIPEEGLPEDIATVPLFRSDPVLAVRRNSPWLDAKQLSDLMQASWIMSSNLAHGPGAAVADLFRSAGLPAPRIMLQSTSMIFIVNTLLRTDFIAALPSCFISSALASSTLARIQLNVALPNYPICAYFRADHQLGPFADYMLKMIRRHGHYQVRLLNP